MYAHSRWVRIEWIILRSMFILFCFKLDTYILDMTPSDSNYICSLIVILQSVTFKEPIHLLYSIVVIYRNYTVMFIVLLVCTIISLKSFEMCYPWKFIAVCVFNMYMYPTVRIISNIKLWTKPLHTYKV